MRTPEFEQYIAPARRYPQIWRLGLGLTAGALTFILFFALIALALVLTFGFEEFDAWIAQLIAPTTPVATFLVLLSFVGMVFGTLVAAAFHWRGLASLLGPIREVARDFIRVAGAILLLFAVTGWIGSFFYDPIPNLDLGLWLRLLPFALLALFIQITAEEMLFRGYLTQQLAARFASPLIWIGLPTFLFGAAHYDPSNGGGAALGIVLATGAFGLIAADLTRRTGNLGAAMGLHFVNNVFALLVVSIQGGITGLSLFVTPFTAADTDIVLPLLGLDIFGLLIAWAVARRVLRH